MKSLHDLRGEYRAARKRYARAFNKWWCDEPWTPEKAKLAEKVRELEKPMFAARDRLAAREGLKGISFRLITIDDPIRNTQKT